MTREFKWYTKKQLYNTKEDKKDGAEEQKRQQTNNKMIDYILPSVNYIKQKGIKHSD